MRVVTGEPSQENRHRRVVTAGISSQDRHCRNFIAGSSLQNCYCRIIIVIVVIASRLKILFIFFAFLSRQGLILDSSFVILMSMGGALRI